MRNSREAFACAVAKIALEKKILHNTADREGLAWGTIVAAENEADPWMHDMVQDLFLGLLSLAMSGL